MNYNNLKTHIKSKIGKHKTYQSASANKGTTAPPLSSTPASAPPTHSPDCTLWWILPPVWPTLRVLIVVMNARASKTVLVAKRLHIIQPTAHAAKI